MKPIFCFFMIICLGLVSLLSARETIFSYHPKEGYVPDAKTALKIAEAIWIPIYGEKQISSEKPFHAILKKDIWIVEGTLPAGYVGGTAVIEISKEDGRILRVSHGK